MSRTEHSRSSSTARPRRASIVVTFLAAAFAVLGIAGTAAAVVDSSGTNPPDTITAPPATDAPDETINDDDAVPSDLTAEEQDEGIDVAPIAIVGFVIVLAIASWWMVRQDDDDDKPSPPPTGEPEWRADQIAP